MLSLTDLNSPFAIDMFESYIYYLSGKNGTLRQMDKFGRGINVTLVTGLELPQDVKVIHKQKQPEGQ